MQIRRLQAWNLPLMSAFFAVCSTGAVLAEPQSANPAPAQPLPSAQRPTGLVVSAPLLSSPSLSAAAKAQLLQEATALDKAYVLVKAGNAFAKNNDWQNAQSQYQQALDMSSQPGLGHQLALYGLIDCCRATGDTRRGLEYSRQAIYHNGSAAEGFCENDTAKLMQFALLLSRSGQEAESVQVYNHAAAGLDYRDSQYNGGQSYLKVPLPEIVAGFPLPGQVQYTPEHLQALADTVLAYQKQGFWSDKEVVSHIQEAVKLYPDSPVTHYYQGEILLTKDAAGAKAAYQKAAELGDDSTNDAVKERLKMVR